jgi:hypothetical protein
MMTIQRAAARFGMRLVRACLLAAVIAALTAAPALAEKFYATVDVPTDAGGTELPEDAINIRAEGAWSVERSLPDGARAGALHRQTDGTWLLSPRHPFESDGTSYEPRDVVELDGTTYTPVLDGSFEGFPASAGIDALFVDGASGDYVLSFDTPVQLDGTWYTPGDLVQRTGSGTFTVYRDAEVAGLAGNVDVVGASEGCTSGLVVTFDVPARVDGTDYLPGQLVRWESGGTFSVYFQDASWPLSSQLRSVSIANAGSEDPDGDGVGSCTDVCPAVSDPSQGDLDGDGVGDACDNCAGVSNPNQVDGDLDGFGAACDCDDGDSGVWSETTEARSLTLSHDASSGTTELSWSTPDDPGASEVLYDVVRSSDPQDFDGFGVCLESDEADRVAEDGSAPAASAGFHYLIRAENGCPTSDGTVGQQSDGTPRTARPCP